MSALFSTAYLPPVQYVATLLQHKDIQIETQETFPKQTYRNRALVMTAGGVRPLIVPIIRTNGNHTRTENIAIDYSTRWPVVHIRTLEAAYAASPYFFHYKDLLFATLQQRYDRLIDLNQALLFWLMKCLKTEPVISLTTDWNPSHPLDFRNTFSPKKIDPIPTNHYQLPASNYQPTPYYQVFSDRMPFTPGLSTVDLLFNIGPEALSYLKKITQVS